MILSGHLVKLPRWRSIRGPVLLLLSATIPIVLMGGVLGYYFTENQKATLDDSIARRSSRLGSLFPDIWRRSFNFSPCLRNRLAWTSQCRMPNSQRSARGLD